MRHKPLVTKCCGSTNWVNALSLDGKRGVDICLACTKETVVQHITLEQYNKLYTNYPITQEQFDSLWN